MGIYENFESIKDMLGYRKFTTEEIIEKRLFVRIQHCTDR